MNVYPRQALEAVERTYDRGWSVRIHGEYCADLTDAEFAAAFVPAERLDALIEAARAVAATRNSMSVINADLMTTLRAALRAYDEGQEQ